MTAILSRGMMSWTSPWCTFLRNIYLYFLSSPRTKMAQVVEIVPRGRQGPPRPASSIARLLTAWRRKGPGQHLPHYWLFLSEYSGLSTSWDFPRTCILKSCWHLINTSTKIKPFLRNRESKQYSCMVGSVIGIWLIAVIRIIFCYKTSYSLSDLTVYVSHTMTVLCYMKTLWHGKDLHEESSGDRWIPLAKPSNVNRWYFLLIASINLWTDSRVTGALNSLSRPSDARKIIIIGLDNGLSPGRRQAIIWTNAGMLLIWHLGTKFSETLIRNQIFS